MSLKIIVAMAEDRMIGKDNQMPWHIPEDLAYFKQTTMGGVVIMGKNTFLSIGAALPGRKNLVLSRDPGFGAAGIEVYSSIMDAIRDYPDAFVIGGASIFEQALPLAEMLYITYIHASIAGDTRFPGFDLRDWTLQTRKKTSSISGYELSFCIYTRNSQ